MDPTDITYWLALKFVENVGSVGFKNLVKAFGSPRAVFDAPLSALLKVPHIAHKTAQGIREFNDWPQVTREIETAERMGASFITADSPFYPPLLSAIYDFPPVLYVKGRLSPRDVCIAVVGSRLASTYGRFITERLCRELAMAGITVVSGMARGIDSAAHRGALAGKGRTIAVLGSGLDTIYPPENKELFEKISENGAVITEYPFTTRPLAANFPSRNRIISGLSLGVVIVEAGEKSGSLITARLALDHGREVFAVPGNIDSPGTRGTHRLLREGAKLVENAHDILEEILPQVDHDPALPGAMASGTAVAERKTDSIAIEEQTILKALSTNAAHIDTLASDTGYAVQDLLRILMSLELKGYITQLPGKTFTIKEE